MSYKRISPEPVVEGGTGAQTFTAYSVITGGTTSTGAFQNTVTAGTAGQILVSAGAASLPVWTAAGTASSISITGDTGGALTGNSFTFTGGVTGLSFGGSGSTETLTFAGITANGGTVSLATDATNSTVNIGTGAGAKLVTLGSTNGASSLALKYGTGNFSMASATGTVMTAQAAGQVNYPLQPAFLAYLATSVPNVTGTGTIFQLGTTTALTKVYDQNSNFNTNGTFTAPVTGKYQFSGATRVNNCTIATSLTSQIVTTNRTYQFTLNRAASNATIFLGLAALADMDSGDTAVVNVSTTGEASNTDQLFGQSLPNTFFSGYLAC